MLPMTQSVALVVCHFAVAPMCFMLLFCSCPEAHLLGRSHLAKNALLLLRCCPMLLICSCPKAHYSGGPSLRAASGAVCTRAHPLCPQSHPGQQARAYAAGVRVCVCERQRECA
eukprot:1150399-Pelagomonas_calceolata.AAC.1